MVNQRENIAALGKRRLKSARCDDFDKVTNARFGVEARRVAFKPPLVCSELGDCSSFDHAYDPPPRSTPLILQKPSGCRTSTSMSMSARTRTLPFLYAVPSYGLTRISAPASP